MPLHTLEHPYPLGLRVHNFGEQYPDARRGTATIVEHAKALNDDIEYVVVRDTGERVQWSDHGTVPAEFDEDFAHDIEAQGDWALCSCRWNGDTLEAAAQHARAYGICGECWGSGTDAYPCLGICAYCGGDGTAEAEAIGRTAEAAAEAEISASEEAERLAAIRDEERMVLDGERGI